MKTIHDQMFGEGSWDKLEESVMGRMKERNPYIYTLLKQEEQSND